MSKKILIIAALIVVVVAAILMFRNGKSNTKYVTATIERGDITDSVSATGRVSPVISVSVGTQVSGTIEKIHVDYNDRVKKGQVLIEIDREVYESRVAEAESALKARKAQHERSSVEAAQTESEFERIRGLFEKGYVSRNEYENAEYAWKAASASLELAEADLRSAEAALDVARENLRKTIIRSPMDGIVLTKDVEEGQTVSASLQAPTLLTMGDLSQMQINASVDEADIGRVEVGQEVRFYVDSYPETVFEGKVAKIYYSPTIEQNVVTYSVLIFVDNSDLALRPGMTATVEVIAAERKDVVLVPNNALRVRMPGVRPEIKGNYVWVLEKGKPISRQVELGLRDEENTEVLNGLSGGETVIVESPQEDKERGMRLRWFH